MTKQPAYKTRPGGSIDYRHYLERSAELRSQEFRAAAAALWRAIRQGFARWSLTGTEAARTAQARRPRVSRPVSRTALQPATRAQRTKRIAQS